MKTYNVYQSGKRLYIDEKENPDNKIVVNKYDNMQQTLRLISDGTLPPRLYWALRNPELSNKYFILPLVNDNELIVGTDISAHAGLWDMLLIGTDDDYIIEGTDIDQSKLTYVSDHFGRLFVRDNFLEELDFEEQTSPTFKVFYDEILDKIEELEQGGVSDAEIQKAVEEYLTEHPFEVKVDSKLSETSTNPVQNKVIAAKLKELEEAKPEIPTTTSQLTNDSGFITEDDLPDVPTKTSELENDSGYISEIALIDDEEGNITLECATIVNGMEVAW